MSATNRNLTAAVEGYFSDLARTRASGGATGELSYHTPLANLLNAVDLDALRPDEQRKILCERKHFWDTLELGQAGYRVITEAGQLPDGGV